MITYVPDNLWGEMLPSIDNTELMKSCLNMEKYLQRNNFLKQDDPGIYGSKPSASYRNYNLFSFPIESLQGLYHNIVSIIKPCLPEETHIIQCWLNVFRSGEFIDWHSHRDKKYKVIHGFYCVNVTPSFTEYKFKHIPNEIFKLESKEGLLVFGKSNDDIHRSSPWNNPSVPRISIAFDIIPLSTFSKKHIRPNYFLPF